MYTVGELCRQFNISRSTLLYYNKIGLLKPSQRSPANYRLYSKEDFKRLERVMMYKKTGVSLQTIGEILEREDLPALEKRLSELNDELVNIRVQQQLIMEMITDPDKTTPETVLTARRFSQVLESIGMTEREKNLFHAYLEKTSSTEHRSFLKFLGLQDEEANSIIKRTKKFLHEIDTK